MNVNKQVCKALVLTMMAGSAFFSACNSDKTTSTETASADSTAVADTTSAATPAATDAPKILGALPPTSEVPYLLQNTGADFNAGLINAAKKVDSYTTTTDKAALNLGAYATDIGYLSVYDKTQDVINYLRSSDKLAKHIGVGNAFERSLEKRFEANLGKKDSLVKIVDESMNRVHEYLEDNDRKGTAALTLTGSFIEGLYISTGLIEKYPKDVPADVRNSVLTNLMLTIIKQKKSLADLLAILKSAPQDAQVVEYTGYLTDLYNQFENLNFDEKVKTNSGDLVVTDKTLSGITAKVKEIRAKIVA
ncbi:hypothetical protein GXP67_33525 [Rhodocytophaga rosea]|uniref:DUF4197 domain-containing protein n=1 Tax=Rhodocytophaga rosea TaxID=2704465 RepID=A0A6C0GSU7_9BACT|nr:hypothetical protein [Rhodocytophaga rosea]QHT71225.1 hypothetical protein GXP67_33525 [Rhodocytophaga rosea]